MKDRRNDTFRGTAMSVLLHGLILAALLFSWHSVKKTESAGGDAGIDASMVKFGDLPSDLQSAITGAPQPMAGEPLPAPQETPEPEPVVSEEMPTPLPETIPEPEPEPAPAVEKPVQTPAPVLEKPVVKKPLETKVAKAAPEKQAKAPAAKPVTKPVEKSTTQKPLTQPTGAAKARAEAMARMRAEQLKDIEGGGAATTSGNPKGQSSTGTKSSVGKGDASGSTSGNQKRWLDAVAKAIERQWLRPDGIPKDQACPIRIRIIPGGEVISASVQPACPYSAAAKQSVHDAVMKASPLPFKGFENDYARDFTVNFYPSK